MKKVLSCVLLVTMMVSMFVVTTVFAGTPAADANGITPYAIIDSTDVENISTKETGAKVEAVEDNGKSVIKLTPQSDKAYIGIVIPASKIQQLPADTTWYAKMKLRYDSSMTYSPNNGIQWYYSGAGWGEKGTQQFSAVSEDEFNSMKSTYGFNTYSATAVDPAKDFEMNIQTFTASKDNAIYIEYIAFFDNEQDCIDYDQPAYPKVSNGGKSADFDRSTKTLNFLCAPQTSADDIKAMNFEIANNDVFSFSGNWEESTEDKYLVMKKTIVDSADAANTWTLVVKSRNQYEVLGLLDCTNSANDSRFKAEYEQTNIGRHTLGSNSVLYFEDNGRDKYETYISIDLKDIINITTTPLYVKIAYRVEDVTGKVDGQSLFLRTAYNSKSWEDVSVIGYGDVEDYQGRWTTAVHKMTNTTTKTDDRFALATVNAKTKLSIKYIAFFETEADAMHYTFGDIGATIVEDGSKITANFNNTENARNGARFVAVYKDNELVKVEMSNKKDELSISGVPAGKYTVKAFYWSDTDKERTPLFDGVSENVTIS